MTDRSRFSLIQKIYRIIKELCQQLTENSAKKETLLESYSKGLSYVGCDVVCEDYTVFLYKIRLFEQIYNER